MTKTNFKKIFLILIIAIFATVLILYYQIKKVNEISVEIAEKPLIDYAFTPIITNATDPILGNPGAPITIIEFLDINSAESRAMHAKLANYTLQYPQKFRLIVLDFPRAGLFASDNMKPHVAARCAFEQNNKLFFSYLDELNKIGKNLSKDSVLLKTAETIQINTNLWTSCLEAEQIKTKINQSTELAEIIGLKKAPEIFINNKRVNYLDEIKIEDLLKEIMKEYN